MADLREASEQLIEELAAMRRYSMRYRQLVDNAPLGIVVIDKTGEINTCNPSMARILGISSPAEAAAVNVFVYPALMEAGISDKLKKCLESGEPDIFQTTYQIPGESAVYLRFHTTPVINGRGRPEGLQAIVEDITEQETARAELQEKNRRIERELHLANTIQSSLFPINLPQVPGATLAATAVAANEVGGDYCDLFTTKLHKLGIAIGDVMGKGVPAALFMAMTYAFVRNYALEESSTASLANKLNKALFPQLEFTQQFITFFYAIYDSITRELLYTNAGHNPPIVYRAGSDECEILEVRDYFLGGSPEASYREGRTELLPGDIVLFYTDGLKEGRNSHKEQFGAARITALLKENRMYDPASIQEIISCEFTEFLGGESPSDDVTMIVIKIDE